MKQRRGERLGIEPPAGDQLGHRDRVGDVGLATDAELSAMGLRREVVGGLDPADVLRPQVFGDALLESFEVQRQHAGWRRFDQRGGNGGAGAGHVLLRPLAGIRPGRG